MKNELKSYWAHGLATIPVKKDKSPYGLTTWGGGVNELSAYDGAYGVGVICGKVSGGLECLDFDNHFGDAKDTLTRFVNEISDLYSRYGFPIESTMNGGYHLLYRCSEIGGNTKLASRPMWSARLDRDVPDAIIETRGEGGYFVAAPTEGYNVLRNSLTAIPEITPEDRQALIDIAKSFNEWYEKRGTEHEQSDRPGDFFNRDPESLTEMIAELESAGWVEVRTGMWRRPDKDRGISATLGKVAENVFYVFSSNAYPFEPNTGYTPFGAIALLKYGGDHKEFARILGEKYQVDKPGRGRRRGDTKDVVRDDGKLNSILRRSRIDLSVPVAKPPVCFKIKDFENGEVRVKRLFTLGNFSALTGKSKSKKSFLASIFMAAAIKNGPIDNKIVADLPQNKDCVMLFDTEQALYDAFVYAERALRVAELSEAPHFAAFDLRQYSPLERCDIIDYALEKYKDRVGYVVIDGIADLVNALNDEDEATRVTSLLMRWTAEYNIHITVVIHQNKNDNWATGHIGSALLKKAEAIISVTKDPEDSYRSTVRCDMIRGVSDFNDFTIEITSDGIGEIRELKNISSQYTERDLEF